MRGLYVHIPFCASKCAYCDFYSLPGRLESMESYVAAVLREANAYRGLSFQTLYLGGGTPSLLGAKNLSQLIDGLRRTFDLSQMMEASIEVNPESATGEFLEAARDSGINRISIGLQSLSDRELKSVGRIHTASQAIEAINRAKMLSFANISSDLIIGLPGQSWQSLETSLKTLIQLNIQHLSVYCLSLEEGTPLAASPPADLPSDDVQAELFEQARAFLAEHGFIHYEISNFALKGYECRHNLNYWRGGEYLGLGPSAASHLDGKRFKNQADLDAYLQNPTGLTAEVEELDAAAKAAEEAMLRLRLPAEGLDTRELAGKFGAENVRELVDRLDRMAVEGLLIHNGANYRLPPSRVLTSNPIFARVLGD